MKTFGKCKLPCTHHHTTASWSCKACGNIELQYYFVSSSFNRILAARILLRSLMMKREHRDSKTAKERDRRLLHIGKDRDAAHRQIGQLKPESTTHDFGHNASKINTLCSSIVITRVYPTRMPCTILVYLIS